MVFRRAAHAAYDTAYHLVWSPKYRKRILEGALAIRVEQMFAEIADSYDITIDEMEVSADRKLWGGEFWEDGYFARTVGDTVTAEVIRKYIRRHKETQDSQLDLFE